MTVNTLMKTFLGVKEVVVESCEVQQNLKDEIEVTLRVHPYKRVQCTCPYCNTMVVFLNCRMLSDASVRLVYDLEEW